MGRSAAQAALLLQPRRRVPRIWSVRRLIAFALLLFSACAHRSPTFVDVDAAIAKELANGTPSIAVAIAKNGAIVHEAAFGGTTVHTPYPLASVTKPLVATGLMVLAERKRVELDQPAHRYAGGWVSTSESYTLRQLLNHTSGLPTYATIRWSGEASPAHDAREMFRRYGFAAHAPGTVSEYSNIGYGLIGHVIAEQSGDTLARFLEREVFRPLGMRNTFMLESATVPGGFARKHDVEGKPLPETSMTRRARAISTRACTTWCASACSISTIAHRACSVPRRRK